MSTLRAVADAQRLITQATAFMGAEARITRAGGEYAYRMLATAVADPARYQQGIEVLFHSVGVATAAVRFSCGTTEDRIRHAAKVAKALMQALLDSGVK
jgi:hypothetical protein